MAPKEPPPKSTPGLRLNCPLGCSKGFLSIRQMNEHMGKIHVSDSETFLRPKSDQGIRKISKSKMEKVRLEVQRLRLKSTPEKFKAIWDIMNENKPVEIYHVNLPIYKQTVNAVVNRTDGAGLLVDALKVLLDNDPRCKLWAAKEENIHMSFIVMQHLFRLVTQDGLCFHEGKWINLSSDSTPRTAECSHEQSESCLGEGALEDDDDYGSETTTTNDTCAMLSHFALDSSANETDETSNPSRMSDFMSSGVANSQYHAQPAISSRITEMHQADENMEQLSDQDVQALASLHDHSMAANPQTYIPYICSTCFQAVNATGATFDQDIVRNMWEGSVTSLPGVPQFEKDIEPSGGYGQAEDSNK